MKTKDDVNGLCFLVCNIPARGIWTFGPFAPQAVGFGLARLAAIVILLAI